ncbi:MAG: hypothetical protein H6738_21125 [Alphaproteobacteria bacterium]|nr:hypothetical protein [Alphaproteobacteria bacterium]MCB9699297.1 hypothetical protein [Alphaproteobacteria bacterium]
MTFAELNPALKSKIEQLGMDAGSMWSEQFRDERGRDPEPEEVDEKSETVSEKLARRARKMLQAEGLPVDDDMVRELQELIQSKFVEFALDS